MGASTYSLRPAASGVAWIGGGVLLIGALTLLVVLIRAGGDGADQANWLVQWQLRSSDNGTLYQLLQDVTAGRALDWSFSPQVFLFPELPISALAFAVTGGDVYGYYVAVAVLDNVLLFVTLLGLVRVLHPPTHAAQVTIRAGVAMLPLLVLPLIGTSWILSFHLAPTYYLGMYVALLAAPLLLLARSRGTRIAVGVALALTAASNPLALLFAAPGVAAALVLLLVRRGWRIAARPALQVAGVLAVALVLRVLVSPLQGTSPFTYVDPQVFAGRLAAIGPYYDYQARDPATAVILAAGVVLAVLCLLAAVAAAVRLVRRRGDPGGGRLLAVVYLGLVPLGGLGATYLLMITHYLYFWPVLVLPFVLALLAVPRPALLTAAATGSAIFLAVALSTGLLAGNLAHLDRYVGFRSAETACIAAAVPRGAVGYATFSDARRLALPSQGAFRLIQLNADARPHEWLTNRAYASTELGSFFYLNGAGDELPIESETLRQQFGEPDRIVACDDARAVWLYDGADARARIAAFYATF